MKKSQKKKLIENNLRIEEDSDPWTLTGFMYYLVLRKNLFNKSIFKAYDRTTWTIHLLYCQNLVLISSYFKTLFFPHKVHSLPDVVEQTSCI